MLEAKPPQVAAVSVIILVALIAIAFATLHSNDTQPIPAKSLPQHLVERVAQGTNVNDEFTSMGVMMLKSLSLRSFLIGAGLNERDAINLTTWSNYEVKYKGPPLSEHALSEVGIK